MTKGIRQFANELFVATLPQRAELGNTAFRREIMAQITMAFEGCSVASAATHYNHAFKTVKAIDPAAVEGLGRAEDKKGGRKSKDSVAVVEDVLVDVIKVRTGEVVVAAVTRKVADQLIIKAATAKKAKLAIA